VAFGNTYTPTSLPGRRYRDERSREEEEEADRLIAKMEAEARNAPGIGTGIGSAIGGGLGLGLGALLASGTGGLGAAAIPAFTTGGAAIGGGLGGAIGQGIAGGSEAKADELRRKRERALAEQEQRLNALAPLAMQLGQRRYS